MPQNNYNDIMEALGNSLKNYTTEDLVKKLHLMENENTIDQILKTSENDLEFHPVERLKEEN